MEMFDEFRYFDTFIQTSDPKALFISSNLSKHFAILSECLSNFVQETS